MQILLSIANQLFNFFLTYSVFSLLFLIIISQPLVPKCPLSPASHLPQLLLAKFSEIPRLKLSLFFNQDTRWR